MYFYIAQVSASNYQKYFYFIRVTFPDKFLGTQYNSGISLDLSIYSVIL